MKITIDQPHGEKWVGAATLTAKIDLYNASSGSMHSKFIYVITPLYQLYMFCKKLSLSGVPASGSKPFYQPTAPAGVEHTDCSLHSQSCEQNGTTSMRMSRMAPPV